MVRKRKIQWLAVIFVPSVVVLILLLNLFFPHQLLQMAYYLYFLPLIFLILYLCFPIGRDKIGGDEAQPSYSWLRWLFYLFSIELILGLLFYSQYHLFYQHLMLPQSPLFLFDPFSRLSFNLFYNKDLFPWTLLAVVALIMGVASFKGTCYWPMSNLLIARKGQQTFFQYAIKIIIAIYLRFAFRFFIAINLVVVALLLALLLRPSISFMRPENSFIVGGMLLLLFFHQNSQKLIRRVNEGLLPIGFFCLLFIVLIAALLVASDFVVVRFILPRAKTTNVRFASDMLHVFVSVNFGWKLWLWGYWILAMPYFASILAKISYGRRIYHFILALLLLPLLVWLLYYFSERFWHVLYAPAFRQPWVIVSLGFVGPTLFFVQLCSRASVIIAWMGFVPAQLPKKIHSRGNEQLLLFAIVIVSLLLLSGIGYLQLLTMLLALPCMIIFIVNMVPPLFH